MKPFDLDVKTAVARARAREPEIEAFLHTRFDQALAESQTTSGPLAGVPYGLKDEWETTVLPTTGGSHRHRNRTPALDSEVYRVFQGAGAVLLGKTNLSDFGLAPESTNFLRSTKNPHALERTAGGSSGGAAAAVADGMIAFDWGTDIGGSIRLPAAFCGIMGLRLSSETWPMTGSFPIIPKVVEWMCGQGPMARTSAELRALLEVAAPALKTGGSRRFEFKGAVFYTPEHLGQWPSFEADVQPHIERAIEGRLAPKSELPATSKVARVYGSLWASNLEHLLEADDTLSLGQGLVAALSSALLRGRLLNDRRFYPNTAELLLLMGVGRVTIYRNRERAMDAGQRVRDAFEKVWAQGLVIVAPVTMYPAPIIGRTTRNMHLIDCTMPGNIADATGLSIPFGTFPGGLPRSIQLLGPPGSEAFLLELGDRIQASSR